MCGGTHRSTAVYLRQKAWQRVVYSRKSPSPADPSTFSVLVLETRSPLFYSSPLTGISCGAGTRALVKAAGESSQGAGSRSAGKWKCLCSVVLSKPLASMTIDC